MRKGTPTPMPARSLLAALVHPGLSVLAACGDDSASESTAAADLTSDTVSDTAAPDADFEDLTGKAKVVVQARDNSFVSQYVTVSAGTEVTFDNRGRNPHNAVPVDEGAFEGIDTEALQPGDAGAVVFDEPGDYAYYCTLHGTETAGMVGTIRVVD